MSEETFTAKLREFTQRMPFVPFVVELRDGRRITVANPAVAFGGGGAGFISDAEGLVDFAADEVRDFVPAAAETVL
jgi:hypothetical protein